MIESVNRALDILLLFLQEEKELGVTQIGKTLGMHKSTVCRILETLEAKGFVRQNPENHKYWLGLQVYSLGMLFRQKESLKKLLYPYAKALADRFNEEVHIIVPYEGLAAYPQHIVLEKIQSQQILSLSPDTGAIGACHSSASGKCLLAFNPVEKLEPYFHKELPAYTANTITDWPSLLQELEVVRQKGYAVDREELEIGLTCVAAPIFNREGKIQAAISLAGPVARIRGERVKEMIEAVRQTAQAMSAVLP